MKSPWSVTIGLTLATFAAIAAVATQTRQSPYFVPWYPDDAPWAISTVRITADNRHGSGVHVGGGYILTAAHVVLGKDKVQVKATHGGTEIADVMWFNNDYDVAMLRAKTLRGVRATNLDCSRSVKIGDALEAIGNPYDIEFAHTFGKVASAVRDIDGTPVFTANMVIAPGMSGGPVFDNRGHLVGIAHAAEFIRSVPLPIGWVVPVSSVCAVRGP